MGVVLKELKECRTALKIIMKKEMIKPISKLDGIFKETEELTAIVAKVLVQLQTTEIKSEICPIPWFSLIVKLRMMCF